MRTALTSLACILIAGHATAFRLTKISFRQGRSSLLFVSKCALPQNAYTYVEGGDYEEQRQEIEAMGGDPFFLSDGEDAGAQDETFMTNLETPMGAGNPVAAGQEERYATDGKGPTPRDPRKVEAVDEEWEWDGIVDEDAHLLDF